MWVWVNSRTWWWTGRPGVLQFMGSQRGEHAWVTERKWTDVTSNISTVGRPHTQNSTARKILRAIQNISQTSNCKTQLMRSFPLRHPMICGVGILPSMFLLTFSKPHIRDQGWVAQGWEHICYKLQMEEGLYRDIPFSWILLLEDFWILTLKTASGNANPAPNQFLSRNLLDKMQEETVACGSWLLLSAIVKARAALSFLPFLLGVLD